MTINKKILSVDFDDDDVEYGAFTKYLEDDTKRRLDLAFKEIDEFGEEYLKEIERKKLIQHKQKTKYVNYIFKHSKGLYTKERLYSYEYDDVLNIYQALKDQRQSPIKNFLNFFLNL